MDYRTIPALAAYIDRIGAQQLNFRKFMIKEWRGEYYYERCLITINKDGTITSTDERYAPTAEEAALIKAALQGVAFPVFTQAAHSKLRSLKLMLREQGGGEPVLFEFYDRRNDTLIMVQQRKLRENGRKFYAPWTFWSDGVWRSMEPDSLLPFWKPRQATNKRRIMVHEGAKAAEYVQNHLPDDHPWKEELTDFEHWGMIGGALAPQRTDWEDLRREKPVEVVYICDNDFAGKSALKKVSNHLRYALKGVMFDERWPGSWDLADKMPEEMFGPGNRWLGPNLRSQMRPATWVTDRVRLDGSKKPTVVLRNDFAEEWFHSVKPEAFIHKDWPDGIHTAQEFNNYMRPFADTDDIARLIKTDAASKTAVIKYTPSLKPGIYSHNDVRFINTHKPSSIKAEAGDYSKWTEFMDHLFPEEVDKIEMLRWCATLIARPEIKMTYGVLLISERQGVGKGTLGEKILAPLLGEENVSFPSESEIVDSNYNYWASHKRLAVVHEIYAGHSAKAYNKLKSIITDHHIMVSQKYMANYAIENWIHMFACSNSIRALKLSMDDRRWFVPKITETVKPQSYWNELNYWLQYEGGLGKVRFWADEWLQHNDPVRAGAIAPWSTTKKEVVEEGYSAGQTWVMNFLDQAKEQANGHGVLLTDLALREGIKQFVYEGRQSDYLESGHTIRKIAKTRGWHVGDDYVRIQGLGTRSYRSKVIATSPQLAQLKTTEDFANNPPMDVIAKAREWMQF